MRRNLLLLVALGCSSDPVMSMAPDGGGEPASDSALGGGQAFTVSWGPVTVPASTEDTRCVEKKLGNAASAWIGSIEANLTASHHMIVYRVPGDTEKPEPYPCQPFLDTLDPESSGAPLMISQIEHETLQLPEGVAFGIDTDQLVRLELHYVNFGDTEVTVDASARFVTLDPAEFRDEANFLFTGNPDIDLPPGESSLGPTWFPLPSTLADVKIFGMTGHTHRWGTDVKVEERLEKTTAGQMVYDFDSWNWEEPPVAHYEPPIEMPAGAGFRFTCSWNNQSGDRVGFGESAEDEMCFFWSYYYPSQGHKVCIHTDQYDDGAGEPGTDICCPDSPYCALVDSFLGN